MGGHTGPPVQNMRKNNRCLNWDYTSPGYYFVTMDVQDKLKLFWDMTGRTYGRTHRSARTKIGLANMIVGVDRCVDLKPNEIGKMIGYWWNEIPNHFDGTELDEYVVMPDHVHGIIKINVDGRTRESVGVGLDQNVGRDACDDGRTHRSARTTCVHALGDIIQWFKTMTTSAYIRGVKNDNWPKFNRRLWQRNYYDQIIRGRDNLERVRKYIRSNPERINLTTGI